MTNIVKILEILIDIVLSSKMFPSPSADEMADFFNILSIQFELYFTPFFVNYEFDNLNGAFLLMENRVTIVSKNDIFLYDLLNFLLNFQALDQKRWFFKKNTELPKYFLGQMISHIYVKWMFIYLVIKKDLWMQELFNNYEEIKRNYPAFFFNLYELKELDRNDDKMTRYDASNIWQRKNQYLCYYTHTYLMRTKILIMGSKITKGNVNSFRLYDDKFREVDNILKEKKPDDNMLILQLTNTLKCIKEKNVLDRIGRWLKKNFQIKNVLVNLESIQRKSEFACEIIYPIATARFVDVIKIRYDHLGNYHKFWLKFFKI
jgi:hypothetical protein